MEEEKGKPDITIARINGSLFIAVYCTGYKLECPHCKNPIELTYTLGTVELKKPEEKKKVVK